MCNAQTPPVTHFSTKNFLPHNTVRSLHLSKNGVLWVGTDNGLVRKHNNKISTYFEEDGIPLNNIWAITEDTNRDIWVGSYGNGIAHFDGSNFTIINTDQGLNNNHITHLDVFGDFLYVGTRGGVSVINIAEKSVVASLNHEESSLMRISGFFEFNNTVFTTTYNTGIYKILNENGEYFLEKISDHKFIYDSERIGDSLFASNKGAVSVFAITDLLNKKVPVGKNRDGFPIIWDYAFTNDKTVYGAAWGVFEENGGLLKFSEDGNSYEEVYGIDSKSLVVLEYNPILELLYAGTLDNGLFQISINPMVQFYPSSHKKTIAIDHFNQNKISLYNDGVDIANKYYDASFFKQQEVAFVKANKNNLPKHEDFFYELNYDTSETDIIFYTIKKSQTHVWINTNIGLYKFRPDGAFESYLPLHTLEFDFTSDNKLIETNPYRGARVYEREYPLKYRYYDEEFPSTPTNIVGTFRRDSTTYFLSVFSGLFSYNKTFKSFLDTGIWKEKKLRHHSIFNDYVAIGNEFGDVFIVDFKKGFKVIKKIDRSEIKGNSILLLDSYKDWLIIVTEGGVLFHNDEKQIFINEYQGITKNIHAINVHNDVLYLGSDGGEYQVNMKSLVNSRNRINNLFVEQIKVNDTVYGYGKEPIVLNSKQNNLEISISTNSHPYPNKLEFYYKMKDNSEWTKLDLPEINLSFLEPAEYNLWVRVNDTYTGQWFEKSVLEFTINPPFYEQWWFRVLVATALVFVTSLYFNRKRKQHQIITAKEIATNKRIERLKAEALLAQMNPHFIFNALNSIQHLVVIGENEKASTYLVKFSKLVRANLNNSSRTFISLKEELDYLKIYCEIENERHQNRISINFIVDPKIDICDTEIPNLILQPFLENAFVHAFPNIIKNPTLSLIINQIHDNKIKCVITDNGIGSKKVSKPTQRTSKGISLIKERLQFLNYNLDSALKIEHTEFGTTVTLFL